MHNEFEQRRKQNIRHTAIEESRKLHTEIMKQINKETQKEKPETETEPEISEEEVYRPSAEEIIKDADKIYEYIKHGKKGL